jgi:hypothetical protein
LQIKTTNDKMSRRYMVEVLLVVKYKSI